MAFKHFRNAIRAQLGTLLSGGHDVSPYAFPKDGDIRADIVKKYGFSGDLVEFYAANKDNTVRKWHQYLPIYDRYFAPHRNKKIRFLEIGVDKGGSLQMWRQYFGSEAVIFGIDINTDCAKFDGQAGQVRIGSQVDPIFLNKVVEEMGGVDIVLDDGSHQMPHVEFSLRTLFPHLANNGLYMIEDLHTAYWPNFGGGYGAPLNFFRVAMELAHDMHRWYHKKSLNYSGVGDRCSAIHIHDSIVVLEKAPVYPPTHSEVP